ACGPRVAALRPVAHDGPRMLRPAASAELDEVAALIGRGALPRAGLERDFPAGFVVAEVGGRIVAAAGVEVRGDAGLLRSLVVDPGLRGRGLARALVDERIAWSRARRLDELWLLTTTAA